MADAMPSCAHLWVDGELNAFAMSRVCILIALLRRKAQAISGIVLMARSAAGGQRHMSHVA
jgi:hypothetical protein